jgi:hypothetical protein
MEQIAIFSMRVKMMNRKKIYILILLILPHITFASVITNIFDGTLLLIFVSAGGIIGSNVGSAIGGFYAFENKGDDVPFAHTIKEIDEQSRKTIQRSANVGCIVGMTVGLYAGLRSNLPEKVRESLIKVVSSS